VTHPAADAPTTALPAGATGAGAPVHPAVAPDPGDPRLARSATGLLATFNTAGVLAAADVHVAARLGALAGETAEEVLLAAALAVRAIRLGSVCVELAAVSGTVLGEGEELVDTAALPWPEPRAWLDACRRSPLVGGEPAAEAGDAAAPLRMVGGLLYLERYWRQEELVRTELRARAAAPPPPVDLERLRAGLARLFDGSPDRQRLAAAVAALRRVTVLAGGPGTGKTHTVARLVALLHDRPGPPPRVALAAPTGKAAARLRESVQAGMPDADRARVGPLAASTLHRLLGWRPGTGRFRHGRDHHLPFDVVVVDETSMVSLTLMARLLEAVRPDARLVLVGDPDQLASVEAGAVLGDLAGADGGSEPRLDERLAALGVAVPEPVRHGVVTLDHTFRFDRTIAALAAAVRDGEADAALALLRTTAPDLSFVHPAEAPDQVRADVVAAGRALVTAARAGDPAAALAALDEHRVLCGHRRGPYGVSRWGAEVERWLAEALPGLADGGAWYPGRPVLVTSNDYDTGLYNGDTGVVVATPAGPRVAFARGGEPLAPSRLSDVVTVHAMTVHRGQGSQFRRVTVVLPPADSPLLTRELLYTAVTRAERHVRIVGTEEAVRVAVGRPVGRASGLRHRLGDP